MDRAMYLDNAATTPVDPRVFDAMLPWLREEYGNPSSVHAHGRRARIAVEKAREHVSALIGADPAEIVFTSGGTESDNSAISMALAGVKNDDSGILCITSPAEHHAVLQPLESLRRTERDIAFLPVDSAAVPILDTLDEHVGPNTRLLSLMHVNNETGGILQLTAAASSAFAHDLQFHVDMVQSAGKVNINVRDLQIDLAALSAHKLHGPKGVGALFIRSGHEVEPLLIGGAQERGRRGGTENVTGIVGFGEAARLALIEREERLQRWKEMRSSAVDLLRDAFEHLVINGGEDDVLANILSVSFPSEVYPLDGEMLPTLCDLNGLSVSSGSACTAGSVASSHVMRAIGHSEETAAASVRLSFGAMTTKEEVEEGTRILIRVAQEMVDPSNRRSHSRMTIP
ncbi:MAG: cysteine desulfurase [Bacteroidetes bacterium]|nr:cysteine desulfurase [Bacteroidota bacterium]